MNDCCPVISSGEMIAVFEYVLICLHSHWSALSINANSEMNCHYSPYCNVHYRRFRSHRWKNELVGGLCFLWSAFASSATAYISRVRETARIQLCFWLHCNSWRNVRHFHDFFLIPDPFSQFFSWPIQQSLKKQVFNHSIACPWALLVWDVSLLSDGDARCYKAETKPSVKTQSPVEQWFPGLELQGCLDLWPLCGH